MEQKLLIQSSNLIEKGSFNEGAVLIRGYLL